MTSARPHPGHAARSLDRCGGLRPSPDAAAVPPALRRLRPRVAPVPPVVHRAQVGPLAWAGLLADGAVVPLWGDVARTAGTPETPAVRAAAVAALVPARAVVAGRTALWLHTGGSAPRRVAVLVESGARRPDPHPGRWVGEAALGPEDVVPVGPVRATTPLRTAVDLARSEEPALARAALARLASTGLDLGDVVAALGRFEGQRGVRAARAVLRAALGA